MNDFYDNFPSLKDKKDVVFWSREAKEILTETCIDKQKLKDYIEKQNLPFSQERVILKELNL